jgi:nitrate/nitrite transporter NarK
MFLASGASYVLVQALVIGRLARRNQERKWLMAAGLLLMAATYAMTLAGNHGSALASTLLMAAIAACAGVIFTCANTLVSLCAAPASRGLVLGMASSVGMLGKTLTTAMSGFMFSHLGANSPYYAALLTAVVLVAIAASLRVDTDNEPEMEPG